MPSLFRAAKKAAESDRVRLFYGNPKEARYVENMTLGHAFALQANAKLASNLLGENEDKKYRPVASPGPSEEATTVKWEPPPALQQRTPKSKGPNADLSPPPVTPAKSTWSSLPATQPRSPWVAKLRLRKALKEQKRRKGCCSTKE